MSDEADVSGTPSSSLSSNSLRQVVNSRRCISLFESRSSMPISSPPRLRESMTTSISQPKPLSIVRTTHCNIPLLNECLTSASPQDPNVRSIIFSPTENTVETTDIRHLYHREEGDGGPVSGNGDGDVALGRPNSVNSEPVPGLNCCFLEIWYTVAECVGDWCCFSDEEPTPAAANNDAGLNVNEPNLSALLTLSQEVCCCCPGYDSQDLDGNSQAGDDIWTPSNEEVNEMRQMIRYLDRHPKYLYEYILKKVPADVLERLYYRKMHPRGPDNLAEDDIPEQVLQEAEDDIPEQVLQEVEESSAGTSAPSRTGENIEMVHMRNKTKKNRRSEDRIRSMDTYQQIEQPDRYNGSSVAGISV